VADHSTLPLKNLEDRLVWFNRRFNDIAFRFEKADSVEDEERFLIGIGFEVIEDSVLDRDRALGMFSEEGQEFFDIGWKFVHKKGLTDQRE
jgi:hypothetical protein